MRWAQHEQNASLYLMLQNRMNGMITRAYDYLWAHIYSSSSSDLLWQSYYYLPFWSFSLSRSSRSCVDARTSSYSWVTPRNCTHGTLNHVLRPAPLHHRPLAYASSSLTLCNMQEGWSRSWYMDILTWNYHTFNHLALDGCIHRLIGNTNCQLHVRLVNVMNISPMHMNLSNESETNPKIAPIIDKIR